MGLSTGTTLPVGWDSHIMAAGYEEEHSKRERVENN